MALLSHLTTPTYNGGDSDDEILNAIYDHIKKHNTNSVTSITNINSAVGLKLSREKEDYFEALLVESSLIECNKPYNSNYYTIKLSPYGLIELTKHGSYIKFKLANLTKEEIYKLILSKFKNGEMKPIADIMSGIGLDPDLADVYEPQLEKRGYIQCGKQGCFITTVGKSFLLGFDEEDNGDNYFKQSNHIPTNLEAQKMNLKIDEIIDLLKKAGIEREILFEEMEELKELFLKLNKKNWKQIVLGKLGELSLSKLIENDTISFVYQQLTGEEIKFLGVK